MSTRDERVIQFKLDVGRVRPRGQEVALEHPGELVLMRISAIMCLFPEHRQVRTIEHGWTLTVCEEDWEKVEKAFRSAYLGMPVHAVGSLAE